MSDTNHNAAPAGNQRPRYIFQAVAAALAITMVAGLLLVLSDRYSTRVDLSATRSHRLSPATAALLNEVPAGTRLVIAANNKQTDADSIDRLADVLRAMQAAAPGIEVTQLDISEPREAKKLDETLVQIAKGEKALIERHIAAANEMVAALVDVADVFVRASVSLDQLGEEIVKGVLADPKRSMNERTEVAETFRRTWRQQTETYRAMGEQLKGTAGTLRTLMGQTLEPLMIPRLDQVEPAARQELVRVAPVLANISGDMEKVIRGEATGFPESAREPAAQLLRALTEPRNRAARAVAAADSLPKMRSVQVLTALSRTQAALVIGPAPAGNAGAMPVVTAITIDEILPQAVKTTDGRIAASPDLRARAEERLSAAMVALTDRPRPLVIFTHTFGSKLSPAWPFMTHAVELLALRGIDVDEWAIGLMKEPPASITDAMAKGRAVVYFIIPPDSGRADGASMQRISELATISQKLVESGESVIFNAGVSAVRAGRAPDPLTSFLTPLGLDVETGKVLLREASAGGQRSINPNLTTLSTSSTTAVGLAVDGLTLSLPWCVPIKVASPAPTGITLESFVRVPASPELWAEGEWQQFRAAMGEQRPPNTLPLPSIDSPADDDGGLKATPADKSIATRDGERNLWTVAAGAKRVVAGREQRVAVIGSIAWLGDTLIGQRQVVDGRQVTLLPGNIELLAAGVNWAARRDQLIAPGALAQAGATIPNMSGGTLLVVRWSLIAGVPVCILLLGALRRVLRG